MTTAEQRRQEMVKRERAIAFVRLNRIPQWEVAANAGVDRSSVSRAFNDPSGSTDKLWQKIHSSVKIMKDMRQRRRTRGR